MNNLRELFKKININGRICFDEPMCRHTTFKIGGPADVFACPAGEQDLLLLHRFCRTENVPVFLLGGGANLLVADAGIRGLVISLENRRGIKQEKNLLRAGAGLAISDLATYAAGAGLRGLEFIYSMPGSVGGALYMNARCYGISVSDVVQGAKVITPGSELEERTYSPGQFSYKQSPFQQENCWILEAYFKTEPGKQPVIRQKMEEIKQDREKKGHFLYPCAGSVFKNNRDFGQPSGAIIDSLGLKGLRQGGAEIFKEHANIIINTGGATAADVLYLIRHIRKRVREAYGFKLEPELILAGAWEEKL